MKTLILITLTMALGLMGVGCSKSSSQSNNTGAANTGYVAPIVIDPSAPTGSSTTLSTGGSTSTFVPVSMATMNEYVATHPLNNPTDFKVNINLQQSASGRYGGTVTISYLDNGIQYAGEFKAGIGTNQTLTGLYDNGRSEADYNYWFSYNSQTVFTAFFQDQYGAITVTLTPENTSTGGGNDAEPITTTTYKGSVYFKNFTTSFATQSPYRSCWYIYNGPYDCRSNVIQTKCGLEPGAAAGYKLLGSFTGVNIKTGFNIQ